MHWRCLLIGVWLLGVLLGFLWVVLVLAERIGMWR
jgi:hypothetical protein